MHPEPVTKFAQRIGRPRSTVNDWIKRGVSVGSRRVKLPATRIGRLWFVTQDEYEAFLAACNPGRQPLPESPAALRARGAREQAALKKRLG